MARGGVCQCTEYSCPVLRERVFTYAFKAYLLIKLIDDAFCPFEVQVSGFGRSVDICELNADLAHKQPVVLIGPVDSWTVYIIHLF